MTEHGKIITPYIVGKNVIIQKNNNQFYDHLSGRSNQLRDLPSKRNHKNIKENLIHLISQIVTPLNIEQEIILTYPRLWTANQYETMRKSNKKLTQHLCREWRHLFDTPISRPPKRPSPLKDINGIQISKSLPILAKQIAKFAIIYDRETAILALKTGLNYLPSQLGCKAPGLDITTAFDQDTKNTLVENITRRGKHAIEEALALGCITLSLSRHNNPVNKETIHTLIGDYLAPLHLDRKNNDEALWVLALIQLVKDEFPAPRHQRSISTSNRTRLTPHIISQLNWLIATKGTQYFIQELAKKMRFSGC